MRVTDNRYATEMAKFRLAVRMIGHEARTGTIRSCTGFSEDRIRKIFATYFKSERGNTIRRRRGKTPTQIAPFVNSSARQSETTILACLFIYFGIVKFNSRNGVAQATPLDAVTLGEQMCIAFETHRTLSTACELCFEKTWTLYRALVTERELYFARCAECEGPYVQDRYALDYRFCPFCETQKMAARTESKQSGHDTATAGIDNGSRHTH